MGSTMEIFMRENKKKGQSLQDGGRLPPKINL
jgi:hypothetical protein